MKVVFLCGGIGKRMFPMTEDKLMFRFLGKSLLQHQVEVARGAGLNDLVFIANRQNWDRISAIVRDTPGIKAVMVMQEQPLGIADALKSARRFLEGSVIVVNPNDVFDGSVYSSLLAEYGHNSADCYILGYRVSDYFPGGYLVVDANGELAHIVEKPGPGKEPSDLVNIVVHLHTDPARLLEYIEAVGGGGDDVYERALDAMVRERCRVRVVPYRGPWMAIKYPWHILSVVHHYLDQAGPFIAPSARVSEDARVYGKVVIGDGVRVLENAVIRGPAYIGANTIIGNNVLVRDYSHVGADCVVGYSSEIKGSYVGDGCRFHSSYVGDSVVGDGCSFGAGTILSNLRFDEQVISVDVGGEPVDTGLCKLGAMVGTMSRIGINASVMPGVRIGSNSVVGPNVCLTSDLEPGMCAITSARHRTVANRVVSRDGEGLKSSKGLEEL
ncbi:MAG: sugar phosphate nucleotidyltransferase [Chloroflexota bacterium]|nr:sugar phosphate nucleotidyltransferase [Chloroflexota bacterium]